jgi:hypothetical protein
MTLRSLISGTVNSLRHTNTNIAKPVEPVITSAALTGADATTTAVAFTQPTIGMPATSFTVTSTPGSITRTGNTSPITYASMVLNPNTNYTFAVSAVGANGTGPSTTSGTVTTQDSYILTQTFTSSGDFTVPAGATKIAVFAVGGGSGGNAGSGGSSFSTHYNQGANFGTAGNGGYSSALAAFKEVSVTPGEVYAVTVGAGGGAGSAGGASSFGNLVTVNGNTVTGNATANGNLNSVTAPTVGNGGSGGGYASDYDGHTTNHIGNAGNISNAAISLSQNLTGLGVVTYQGTDGGGGGAGYGASPGVSNRSGGSGGNAGGGGGTGAARGSGGGGGGAGAGGSPAAGSGQGGAVYVYVRY